MNKHKTILVPTDFRVASLNTLRLALGQTAEPTVNVVLLHCRFLDESITELLFYSPARLIRDLLTDDFEEALGILRNRFETQIGQLQIELFHGKSQRVFDALLATLKIDAVYYSRSYRQDPDKRAFNASPYIVNGVVPHYDVDGLGQQTTSEKDKLENLFLN